MENPFYFSLARISAAQILRAAGIDRTRPSTLDALTDILIRYLHLLGQQSMSFSLAAGHPDADIRDICLAMEDLGIVAKQRLVSKRRIRRMEGTRRNIYDERMDVDEEEEGDEDEDEDDSSETLRRVLNWFKGPQAAECRRVAGAGSIELMNNFPGISMEQSQRPSFIAEYVTSMTGFPVIF
jgi:transcription initiation factor TFIID subunit 3